MNQSKTFHFNTSIEWKADPYVQEQLTIQKLNNKPLYNGEYELPLIKGKDNKEIISFLNKRKSTRCFSGNTPLNLNELSLILESSLRIENMNSRYTPSAGKLYPIETFIIVNNVKDLIKGIYYYNQYKHLIAKYSELNNRKIETIFLEQPYSKNFSVGVIMLLDLSKVHSKYNDRGYRYGLIEAGHIAQNILLTSINLSRESIPVGAFIDFDILHELRLSNSYLPIYSVFIS